MDWLFTPSILMSPMAYVGTVISGVLATRIYFAVKRPTRWQHTDAHCPMRPIWGRIDGRTYRCECGRRWTYRVTVGVLSTWRRWELRR